MIFKNETFPLPPGSPVSGKHSSDGNVAISAPDFLPSLTACGFGLWKMGKEKFFYDCHLVKDLTGRSLMSSYGWFPELGSRVCDPHLERL